MNTILLNNIDYLLSDEYVASYVRTLALCLCQQGELEARQRLIIILFSPYSWDPK
ncbi:unnamed protein product, partial [Rotaria magnacalcarata]